MTDAAPRRPVCCEQPMVPTDDCFVYVCEGCGCRLEAMVWWRFLEWARPLGLLPLITPEVLDFLDRNRLHPHLVCLEIARVLLARYRSPRPESQEAKGAHGP